MKSMLGQMRAMHSARKSYGLYSPRAVANVESSMRIRATEEAHREVDHPVVRTHVESEEESAPVLDYLYQHAVRPEFTCRFCWEKGSIAFWDNRCVQHNAINDYNGQRRVMHRVTIEGERPI
jgi:taurine dioxygenase